ncbi:uncharacterized protein A4U43_C04F33000 [Asparagus officinalis]|uniref:Uncharacterized protein n=1 Tax=Asparagus officinalis TaxID=4686 RepID=A0A5P1F5F5_ASPOF|nr:uncharacterized protein A4U43_C04F33000 [Asparagus officinalis]
MPLGSVGEEAGSCMVLAIKLSVPILSKEVPGSRLGDVATPDDGREWSGNGMTASDLRVRKEEKRGNPRRQQKGSRGGRLAGPPASRPNKECVRGPAGLRGRTARSERTARRRWRGRAGAGGSGGEGSWSRSVIV